MTTTIQSKMEKKANILAQSYRKKHGDKFENSIDVKLTKHGIPSRRRTIQIRRRHIHIIIINKRSRRKVR